MRRMCALIAALAVGVVGGLVAPAEASTTQQLTGTFKAVWPLPKSEPRNAPCQELFCGSGQLAGYGGATITIDDVSLEPIDGTSCFGGDMADTIALNDGSGALALSSTGRACERGGSGGRGGPHDFGNPALWTFHYTIDAVHSSGAFAGASGSGTTTLMFAGAIARWTVDGSITTP